MQDNNPEPTFAKGSFPSPLLPREIMNQKGTGLAVAKAIYNSAIDGENSYYSIRNSEFAENRVFAAGKQPFQTYLDLLGTNGATSFMNLDYHPRPIAPKFRDILVNDIMDKIESVECTGLSQEIQQRKQDKKNEAAFRMQHGDFIQTMEKTSGMQLTNPQEYTPENEDELELWMQLNDKEKEELLMELGIDFILYNNDWNSVKKSLAEDLTDCGFASTMTYFDGRKRIRIKRIRPEYRIYGTTNTLNFKNTGYDAHVERLAITDLRAMYPEYPERLIWNFAYAFKAVNGNPNELSDYIIDFQNAYTRPYDSWLIDVMFFEYRVIKTIDYVKGVDRNENPIFEFRKGNPDNPTKKPYKTTIPTYYQGAWVLGADSVLKWGEMENMIRSNEDVEDVCSSYSTYMLNNNGDMLPLSPMKAIRSSIIQMDLAILRMQHTIATTPPNGLSMDLDSIMDVDLGKGIGKLGPMKMREIYTQTGDTYFSSSKISGEWQNRKPIEQNVSTFGDKLKSYIEVYNFELNCIRDYIGVNEVKDGSEINPRMGLGVMNGAQQASNTATAHLYGGFVSVMTDTVKSVATLFWDALNTDTTNKMYIKLLGKQNAEFMTYADALTKTNYSTRIAVNMSLEDLAFIEKTLDTALQQGKLLPEDALMVRKYARFNTDYAIRYLSLQEKKRAKDAAKIQQQQAQQQQQATAQLAQQQHAQKKQADAVKSKQELDKVNRKGQLDHASKIQDLINAAMIEFQQNGAAIPIYVQNLINIQMAAHINQQEAQIDALEESLYAHDLQALGAQQQAMNQQQGQVQQPQQPQAA